MKVKDLIDKQGLFNDPLIKSNLIAQDGKDGDCWRCGQLLPPGYEKKICPECIDKANKGREAKKRENLYQWPHNKQP